MIKQWLNVSFYSLTIRIDFERKKACTFIYSSPGQFIGAGGEGGSDAEPGGPGTTYLHLLPETGADQLLDGTVFVVTHDSNHTGVFTNRTLYIDNR